MRGESFNYGEAMRKIEKASEKHPEKFPFKQGELVWVRNKKTGEMEEYKFIGWDPNSGEAIVTRGELDQTHEMRKVSRDDLLEKMEEAS